VKSGVDGWHTDGQPLYSHISGKDLLRNASKSVTVVRKNTVSNIMLEVLSRVAILHFFIRSL
jgi:hypothetical protein